MTKWFAYILVLVTWQSSPAQSSLMSDTIKQLPEAIIVSTSLREGLSGTHQEHWNTDRVPGASHLSVGDFLTQQGGVFVKNYGTGNSATTSIRGGSAGHTRVLWNGLPLEQPMLGQMDFSLLPLAIADEVHILYGGNSAGWGSGAVSGVIQVNNRPDFEDHRLQVNLEQGSFGLWQGNASAGYGTAKWLARTHIFWQQAANDFPYRIRPDLPKKMLEHAFIRQSGAYQEGYIQLNKHQQLAVYGWYQQANREIPPTTQQTLSEASQDDQSLRTAAHWTLWSERTVLHVRAGVYRENLIYQDPRAGEQSTSHFWTVAGEGTWQWHITPHQRLEAGITETWHQAATNAYLVTRQQWRIAPFLGYRLTLDDFEILGVLREEVVDGQARATTPSLSLQWQPDGIFQLYGQVARNYRLPTLNDLYWQPGGNPELLPETGWGQEFSMSLQNRNDHFQWKSSLTAFSRQIKNWILWSPLPGQSIWSPQNLSRVWSRGLEIRGQASRSYGKMRFTGDLSYHLTWSTNEIAQTKPLLPAKSQLVYVPRHLAVASLHWQWRNWGIQYRQLFTSDVNTLNAGTLRSYSLGNIIVDYKLSARHTPATGFVRINNLWNVSYRSVEYRPMPGRHYALGIHLEMNLKNKNI